MEAEMTFDGLDELVSDLESLAHKFPDRFGELLKKEAEDTRKDVVREVKSAVDIDSENRYSLAKAKNYKISQIKGYGESQYVEMSAQSPHFHLIENGHTLVSHTGQAIGWVPGYKIMDAAVVGHKIKMPINARRMADELLKAENFI